MASSTRKWRGGRRNGSATSVAWHRREAKAEAGVTEKMMSKTDPQKHFATYKGRQGRGSRQATLWPMLYVRRATFREREKERQYPNLGKGGPTYPIITAWTSWRQGSFPGPTSAQGNSLLPKPYKGKGKGKSKQAKEKQERATQEKEMACCLDWVSIHVGDRHLATRRTGTRRVTRQSLSHSPQRCGM